MTDRVIASRPSLEQVQAIVDFMEKHPALGLGQLRGFEGRDEGKKLWLKLTRLVNSLSGPTRPVKSWVKFWADKKSTVRSKVQATGDPNNLGSNIEKKIWDLFLANETGRPRGTVKREVENNFLDENFYNEDSMDHNHTESEQVMTFEDPMTDTEERQHQLMEKMLKVLADQSSAMSQLANASHLNAQAMERLAEASQIQARAIDRLANSFETISAATHDVRNAIVDIDVTMKRFYSTSPT
uniref:SFRICE_009900 n=1 Tax=Spodoptera frugiperda TaxID=7108 RepID=A0A2H1V4I2_SPOFR